MFKAINAQASFWGFGTPQRKAASREVAADATVKPVVLVTGASGKTGKIVARKIKESEDYSLRALTRTEEVSPTKHCQHCTLYGLCHRCGGIPSVGVSPETDRFLANVCAVNLKNDISVSSY